MTVPTLADLLARSTLTEIYNLGITVARGLGLPVDSWIDGDATKSLYWYMAEELDSLEVIVVGYISSGFLDFAAADPARYPWLVRLADQMYGYTADEAISASTEVELTNAAGATYTTNDLAAGNLTFENTVTGVTYTNSTGPVPSVPLLPFPGPGNTVLMTVAANEAGSNGSAGAGDIALQTALPGVTATNATAAIGTDDETAQSIVAGARAKLGPLSPSGPKDAYDSIATDAEKTGEAGVTRSRTYHDSTTGDVTQYYAGPSGAVSGPEVTAVNAAIANWATPLCITHTGASAANISQAVTYELWLYDSVGMTDSEVEAVVLTALQELFVVRPIGGDIKAAVGTGKIYQSMIEGTIRALFPGHFVDVDLTVPAIDTAVGINEVPVLGVVTATAIHFEAAPA